MRALPRVGLAASLALGCRAAAAECEDDRLAKWVPKWKGTLAESNASWHIGRHVHPSLAAFEDDWLPPRLGPRARVLVPLCGASHDVAHLAWRGRDVVAVEGVRAALDAFRDEYGVPKARRTLRDRVVDWFVTGQVRRPKMRPDLKNEWRVRATHSVRLPVGDDGKGRVTVTWHEASARAEASARTGRDSLRLTRRRRFSPFPSFASSRPTFSN